jgi:photosystem II stability/assembly factor-like uncharacterized protein
MYYAGRNTGGTYFNKTGNIRQSWSTYPNQPQGTWDDFSTVNAIAINPNNDAIMFMGFSGGGILRTTNGGSTWQPANQGFAATFVTAIVSDPFNPSVLYASTNGSGVFKSLDKGMTWSSYFWARQWDWAMDVAADTATPNKLYVATENYGIGVSQDGGASWTAINGSLPTAPIGVPPSLSPASSAYADEETDQAPLAAVATPSISAVAVAPTSPTPTLYAGTWGHGLYLSQDGGNSWKPVDNTNGQLTSGLPSLDILTVFINPNNPTTLYAGTTTGVYISTNGGNTWNLYGLPSEVVNSLAIDPVHTATFYAGTQLDGIMRTDDSGSTWSSTGISSGEVDVLYMDPSSRLHIYAGVNGGGIININYSMMIVSLFIRVVTPSP